MKIQQAVSVIFILCSLQNAVVSTVVQRDLNVAWQQYKKVFGKFYSQDEDVQRRIIWEENYHYVNAHNWKYAHGMHSYNLKMNRFADLTLQEFKTLYLTLRVNDSAEMGGSTFLAPSFAAVPVRVDWRRNGYVTPVKDQGACGSCYSFSTTGSLEGQHFRKTGILPSLSEQQIVDCSSRYGNMGCNGGLMTSSFKYIKDNGGIDSESCYPYSAHQKACRFKTSCVTAKVTGFVTIARGSESDLERSCASVGPISVAIDASHRSFQLYHSGVYYEPSCSSSALDHAVLVVGYDSLSGKDYWIVKNSWGTQWGMDGYIKMSRNRRNHCGIASMASYPLV